VAVCTHLDQVSQENMDEQLRALTKTPWPRGVLNTNRVIPCFSRICSTDPILPNLRSRPFGIRILWVIMYIDYCSQWLALNNRPVRRQNSRVKDPRTTYDQFSIQVWRDKLQAELRASDLPRALQRLTKEMIDSARVNALLSKADTVIGLLIVPLQPRGLPPPPVVAFPPQASPAKTATISPSSTFQFANPGTSYNEWTHSIIATPGIERDALDDICTWPTSPTISVSPDDQRWWRRSGTRACQVKGWSRPY